MDEFDLDANKLAERIGRLLDRFEQTSGQHQRDESFVAVDAKRYTIAIKLRSPFGNGAATEQVASTNELQQRVNHWIGVQRQLGLLGAVRLVLTPDVEDEA
jgi:hypothetical protein